RNPLTQGGGELCKRTRQANCGASHVFGGAEPHAAPRSKPGLLNTGKSRRCILPRMKREGRYRWARALRGLAAACSLSSLALAAFADADEGDAAVREQFRAAYAAAAIGVDTADGEALRAYVLYPYLRETRLERALARAQGPWQPTDDAALEFLAQTGDAPVALLLRRAWLVSLARRESWEAFLAQYETAAATPALECQRLNARIAREETGGAGRDARGRATQGAVAELA